MYDKITNGLLDMPEVHKLNVEKASDEEESATAALHELILALLCKEPSKRATAETLLLHPFMNRLAAQILENHELVRLLVKSTFIPRWQGS